MNENINLCEILKGHEGEIFYSPLCGDIKLIEINCNINIDYPIKLRCDNGVGLILTSKGRYYKDNKGEIQLFPLKDQRDWIKWDKENNHKTPKTWSDLVASDEYKKEVNKVDTLHWYGCNTPIEKSALALLKIHQLIEIGYDGNVTNEDIQNNKFAIIKYNFSNRKFIIQGFPGSNLKLCLIYFKNTKLADEFLSYPENVQLLKDYFMI